MHIENIEANIISIMLDKNRKSNKNNHVDKNSPNYMNKWCSLHKTTSHDTNECRKRGFDLKEQINETKTFRSFNKQNNNIYDKREPHDIYERYHNKK
ncbi:MAG: hypothetical protein ACRCZW_00435 [Lactobacillaceae bacterium]